MNLPEPAIVSSKSDVTGPVYKDAPFRTLAFRLGNRPFFIVSL